MCVTLLNIILRDRERTTMCSNKSKEALEGANPSIWQVLPICYCNASSSFEVASFNVCLSSFYFFFLSLLLNHPSLFRFAIHFLVEHYPFLCVSSFFLVKCFNVVLFLIQEILVQRSANTWNSWFTEWTSLTLIAWFFFLIICNSSISLEFGKRVEDEVNERRSYGRM